MALDTPTTKEVQDQILGQIEAAINQTVPLLSKAFNRIIAKALGAVFMILYKYGGFQFLQIFVAHATIDETLINGVLVSPLKEWGRLIGIGDPVPGTQAELLIEITVETQTGSLAAGTQSTSNKNGYIYITKTSIALDAATKQVEIIAINDPDKKGGVGAAGNLDPGDTVSFVNPVDNVARDTVVISQVVTGADEESVEAYRQRIITRFQQRPQGGAYADYVIWGTEVSGIINIYPYAGLPGEVDVYVEATPESSGNPDGIPTQAQLDAVDTSIQFDEDGIARRRPVTAFVNVYPITRTGFTITVLNLIADNLIQTQEDIENALDDFFAQRAPFIDGLTTPPRTDLIDINSLTGVVDDFATAQNGFFDSVSFVVTGSVIDLTKYVLSEGEKAKVDIINFTTS